MMEQTDASQTDRLTSEPMSAAESTDTRRPVGVVITWDVTGPTRHLSHAELMRVFERAGVRARLPLCYSQGFNPHPRMSLPLPKTVGLESSGDVLCMQLWAPAFSDGSSEQSTWAQQILSQLAAQCPAGIRVHQIQITAPRVKWHPVGVTFELRLHDHIDPQGLSRRIETLLKADQWPMERIRPGQHKCLDARSFIKTIQLKPPSVWIEVEIRPTGSLQVNEIRQLLKLEPDHLAAPIRRCAIQWQSTQGPGGRVFTSTGETECHEK